MIDVISQVMYLHAMAHTRRRGSRLPGLPVKLGGALVLAASLVAPPIATGQERVDRRLQQRLEEAGRKEAEALVALVDRAMAGERIPSELSLGWRHDFLKAQPGTFVPFALTVGSAGPLAPRGLVYVRVVRREPGGASAASERRRGRERYAFDAIFAVDLQALPGEPVRITRGFAVPAGDYDLFVALRERPDDPLDPGRETLRAAVLSRPVSVPDFWSGQFTTSTVLLARRVELLPKAFGPDEALERPYAIGLHDVHVAWDATFRPDRELVVVFVIYDPAVGTDGDFDVQVDYHVYRRAAGGSGDEKYVTRTNPQRFNRGTLGPLTGPGTGGPPIMAGQGILLSSLMPGEYRLGITVRDLLSGEKLTRDVVFKVAGEGAR